jgi:hypothetical protein
MHYSLVAITVSQLSFHQIVYKREQVAVWPSMRQRISGRLSLIKQHGVLFVAWLPYSRSNSWNQAKGEPGIWVIFFVDCIIAIMLFCAWLERPQMF